MKTIVEFQEKAEIARGRAYLYGLLSLVFRGEITPDFLKKLRSEEGINSLKALGIEWGENFLKAREEELLEELAVEYTCLFVAPGSVSPYESVWLTGRLFQGPSQEVEDIYSRCGLTLPLEYKVFPDQAGIELEFMGYLAARESEAWADGREKDALKYQELQREFLGEHLGRWILEFSKEVEKVAFHPFYRETAKLSYKFMALEVEDLILNSKREGIIPGPGNRNETHALQGGN